MTNLPAKPAPRHIIIAVIALIVIVMLITNTLTTQRLRAQLAAGQEGLWARITEEIDAALSALGHTGGFGLTEYREALGVIRRHMFAANALNDVLAATYGDASVKFNPEMIDPLFSALDDCDRAVELGQSIEEPIARLRGAMDLLLGAEAGEAA